MQDFYPDRNLTEYAICYLSNFKRDNLIHELDSKNEAKPFWAGIFTTPHRLMNAMLNLGKVKKDHVVVDPFCHTGTLAIEASQIGCKVICADIAEIQGAADNYEFLCKGSDNFLRLVNALHGLVKASPDVLKQLNDLASESAVLNVHGIPEIDDRMRIDRIMNRLSGREGDLSRLENRLFFYILRRYELNRKRQFNDEFGESLEMVRQYLGKQTITEQEGDDKLEYYNGYFHFSRQMKAFEAAFKTEGVPIVKATHREFKDLFEDSQYPSTRIGFVSIADSSPDFLERDILQSFDKYGIGKDSLDAVITDPPYGYGEDLKKQQIYDIYRALFEKAFGWLKDGGHLVYCTLDKVRTGRIEGLLFTEDIIKLCNEVAAREKIEFVSHSIYPIRREPSFLFYWKSKWALNRAIVALKISKKSIRNVKGK
jgi:hypothetical protein